nr:PREDICTED: uncharacterized protein LOC105675227 [Linepithema humile]
MIAKDNLPFATVEKQGFKTFMKIVAPLYKIPSRKKITSLIEEKYEFLSDTENIIIVVSDNAANMKKAITEAFGTEKHLACFAHTLNLIPSNIIKNDDELRAQSTLKLIQSVETRWNSTYDMLERFIELADKISSILLKQPTAPIMLTAFELQAAKDLSIIKPFNEATKIICGEHYLTGSKILDNLRVNTDSILEVAGVSKGLKESLAKLLYVVASSLEAGAATLTERAERRYYDPIVGRAPSPANANTEER